MIRQRLESMANYVAYAGLGGIFIGLAIWLIHQRFDLLVEIPLFVGLALIGLFILLRPAAVRQALSGRQARYGSNTALLIVAFLGILVLANFLANRHPVRFDLTADRAYSLSPQTVQILRGLKEPISIVAFLVSSDTRRAQLQDLLDEYRFHSDKIAYEFIDPELKPALAKQYGIRSYGVLVLECGDRRQEAYVVDEQDLTAAILKVSREEQKTIYFVTGHKERDPESYEDGGYAAIKAALERDNYRVKTLNLSAITDTVPADAAALIVASPQITFTEQERNHFIDYLYNGGKVLLTLDPVNSVVDPYIMSDWGLRVRDDLVVDPSSSFFGDVGSPMVTRYGWHEITKDMGGISTFFIYARSLEVLQPSPPNIQVTPLIQTSNESWGETSLLSRNVQVQFDEGTDTAGPLTIAVAVNETARGGRLVVFGDSDFVTNEVLMSLGGTFGNADLFLNAVNWLTEEKDLIAITPKETESRQVILTRPQMRLILYSSTILLPLVILAVGAATWWANR